MLGRIVTPLLFFFCSSLLLEAATLQAEVFYAKDEALKLAFPTADRIEPHSFVLDAEQHTRVEALAKAALESNLVTFYQGYQGQQYLGAAVIETHRVRSMPETVLIVVDPQGKQRKVMVLAFHEPSEYLASSRWLQQFEDVAPKTSSQSEISELVPGRAIHGIVGSTLTANAVSAAVRRVLALSQVLLPPVQQD
jgi:hypothetical protein